MAVNRTCEFDEHDLNCHEHRNQSDLLGECSWVDDLHSNSSACGKFLVFDVSDNTGGGDGPVANFNLCEMCRRKSFTSYFTEKHVQGIEEIAQGIDIQKNFFNEFFHEMNITHPADPFYTFGIELRCSLNNKSILHSEGIVDVPYYEYAASQRSVDVGRLIKLLHKYGGRHLLASMANILQSSLRKQLYPEVGEYLHCLWRKYNDRNDRIYTVIDYLICETRGSYEDLKTRAALYGEKQLSCLVSKLLDLEGCCGAGYTIPLQQYSTDRSDKSSVYTAEPGLVFSSQQTAMTSSDYHLFSNPLIVQCKLPDAWVLNKHTTCNTLWMDHDPKEEGEVDEDETLDEAMQNMVPRCDSSNTCKISCKRVWQIYLQLFGMLMMTNYDIKGQRHVVLQSGLLIENDEITVVVLSVKANMYVCMKQCKNMTDTLQLLKQSATKGDRTCTLYISREKHPIYNIGVVSRTCYTLFCGIY